jgi:hypothetical protein
MEEWRHRSTVLDLGTIEVNDRLHALFTLRPRIIHVIIVSKK